MPRASLGRTLGCAVCGHSVLCAVIRADDMSLNISPGCGALEAREAPLCEDGGGWLTWKWAGVLAQ